MKILAFLTLTILKEVGIVFHYKAYYIHTNGFIIESQTLVERPSLLIAKSTTDEIDLIRSEIRKFKSNRTMHFQRKLPSNFSFFSYGRYEIMLAIRFFVSESILKTFAYTQFRVAHGDIQYVFRENGSLRNSRVICGTCLRMGS